jgi:hypothetical protein
LPSASIHTIHNSIKDEFTRIGADPFSSRAVCFTHSETNKPPADEADFEAEECDEGGLESGECGAFGGVEEFEG